MNAAMHTIFMAFLFQTYNIKILNANSIEAIDIHLRELIQYRKSSRWQLILLCSLSILYWIVLRLFDHGEPSLAFTI